MKPLIILILSAFTISAFSATEPKVAYEMMKQGEAVIIDVREESEIKAGMLKDAKWFPLSKILNDKNWKEDFDKLTNGKKIFLHCRSGKRSGRVVDILKTKGLESENIGGYEKLKRELTIK